jgi:hypothetical protein
LVLVQAAFGLLSMGALANISTGPDQAKIGVFSHLLRNLALCQDRARKNPAAGGVFSNR